MSEWISVNEKLPPLETDVLGLCTVDDLHIESLILVVSLEVADGEWYFSPVNQNGVDYEGIVEVTHWQPLPEPPED